MICDIALFFQSNLSRPYLARCCLKSPSCLGEFSRYRRWPKLSENGFPTTRLEVIHKAHQSAPATCSGPWSHERIRNFVSSHPTWQPTRTRLIWDFWKPRRRCTTRNVVYLPVHTGDILNWTKSFHFRFESRANQYDEDLNWVNVRWCYRIQRGYEFLQRPVSNEHCLYRISYQITIADTAQAAFFSSVQGAADVITAINCFIDEQRGSLTAQRLINNVSGYFLLYRKFDGQVSLLTTIDDSWLLIILPYMHHTANHDDPCVPKPESCVPSNCCKWSTDSTINEVR